jgi:signal transduction histidine kinase
LKLKQVVTNLLVNAIKYTPDGGQVTLRVYWSAAGATDSILARRSAVVEVSDTGPGIAPEHRTQVFQRGFRVGAVPGVEGEGIGLSVVEEIVTQHGGSISIGGEVGRGSVFTVRLPQDRRQRGRSGPLSEP